MLTRLGRFTVRRRRLVLSFTVLFMVVAAVIGTRAFGVLAGRRVRGSLARRAPGPTTPSIARFDTGEHDLVLVVTASAGDVDAPGAVAAGDALAAKVARGRRSRRRGVVLEPRPTADVAQRRAATAPWCSCASTTARRPPRTSLDGDPRRGRRRPRRPHRRRRWRRSRVRSTSRPRSKATSAAPRRSPSRSRSSCCVLVFGGLVAAVAPAVRRRRRGARHVPVAVRASARSPTCRSTRSTSPPPSGSAWRSTTACSSCPATARSCAHGRSVERRRRAHRRDRRAHGGDQRADRRGVARRAAGVPAVLPALVRLRRHRRRAAGDGRRRSSPCPRCSPSSARGSTRCASSRTARRSPSRRASGTARPRRVMRRPLRSRSAS